MCCIALLALPHSSDASGQSGGPTRTLSGVVRGNGALQPGYQVTLYASEPTGAQVVVLGSSMSDGLGRFDIAFRLPHGLDPSRDIVLYVLAEQGESMLGNAVGQMRKTDRIVVDERTTVALGVAFAQFVDERMIRGNRFGMQNAVQMAANMANSRTGEVGVVLAHVPNGDRTSTLATFLSLANMVAGCVDSPTNCEDLFDNAPAPSGARPKTVVQAVANLTRLPAPPTMDALFELSLRNSTHVGALASDRKPTSWLLFIKFTGGRYDVYAPFNLMSGPGSVSIDEGGVAWVNDNYVPTADLRIGCAGQRLMKFHPWGESFSGSPFFGGGLSGAGFGITLDPRGRVWVGNFGFEAPACSDPDVVAPDPENKIPATHDSVSVFLPNGQPISGEAGFTGGHIWWPQATVSDEQGNIWMANCGNDSVTFVPKGNPQRARNIALPGGQAANMNFEPDDPADGDSPLLKPFGLAIDPHGDAWVSANLAPGDAQNVDGSPVRGRVFRVSSDGAVVPMPTIDAQGKSVMSWPMGVSGDSRGNIWVSNSNTVNVPCVDPLDPQDGEPGASLALYPADGSAPRSFGGGGITIPWGNAVDGNDTVWVFNFGQQPTKDVSEDTVWPDTPLSHFCGADESRCPAGTATGGAISPPEGYVTDALDRVTGGAVDPSGNLWLMNNWKKTGPYPPVYDSNPGGNSIVIVPGAAAPLRTPLIGPPSGF